MRYIYILATKEKPKCHRLIQFCVGEEYYHSAISVDDNLTGFYAFRMRMTKEYLQKIPGNLEIQVYAVPVTNQQYLSIRTQLEWFYTHRARYSYNVLGVTLCSMLFIPLYRMGFRFQIPASIRVMKRHNKYHCSTFIRHVLDNAGVTIFTDNGPYLPAISPWLTSPYDFPKAGLQVRYSGKAGELARELSGAHDQRRKGDKQTTAPSSATGGATGQSFCGQYASRH